MRKLTKRVFIGLCISMFLWSCQNDETHMVVSPDGNIKVVVAQNPDKSLLFMVFNGADTIVQNSPLGIKLSNEAESFTTELDLQVVANRTIDEQYNTVTGKQLLRHNQCSEMELQITNKWEKTANIVLRAYNDGMAFRYKLNNNKPDSVTYELSGFNFATDSIWSLPFNANDEYFWDAPQRTTTLNGKYLSLPVLARTLNKNWVLVSESDVSNYPLSCGQFNNGLLNYAFAPKQASNKIATGFVSPWRFVIIGNTLNTLVKSCLTDHLAPTNALTDVSWIEPGVTSFPWWANNLANSSPEVLKKYIDLSSAMGWRWVEFDIALIGSPDYAIDKWKTTPWIKEVVEYGRSKNVLCYGWDDIKNLDTPEKRDDVFGRYVQLGIGGIKVDYVSSYAQQTRQWVEDIIKDAARYKLMVSFHGAQSPRGTARQYPHVVTIEAVCGSEYYIPINGAKAVPPRHNCTLPFTRNILGSMDYTPVAFSPAIRKTTMAHELALSVIYESGWQGMCDAPEHYLNSMAKPFLTNLPVAWDETRFLGGYPGEYCCMARRKGTTWYVAGINAGKSRTVSLSLPFNSNAIVQLYTDLKEELNSLNIVEQTLSPNKPLEITMEANGGFAFVCNSCESRFEK